MLAGLRFATRRRGVCTLVTPGQGIISQEWIELFKPHVASSGKVRELMDITDETTKLKISSVFRDDGSSHGLDLQRTSVQQPLIILMNALQRCLLLEKFGVDLYGSGKVDLCVGHSVGEITNLALQETMSFADAIHLAHRRGSLMEALVGASRERHKMFVLVIDRASFAAVLNWLAGQNTTVAVSNINNDEQLVISGTESDCRAAISGLEASFRLRRKVDLQVAIPFHNEILAPIAPDLTTLFQNAQRRDAQLKIKSVANLDGAVVTDTSTYVDKIVRVTSQTVNFKKCIDTVLQTPGTELTFVHYSPVTRSLVDRYLRALRVPHTSYSLDSETSMKQLADSW